MIISIAIFTAIIRIIRIIIIVGGKRYNRNNSNLTREMLIADMIDVLCDILEELRLIRSSKSDDRLVETTQELVTAEWRDLALVIDRACLICYGIGNIVFTMSLVQQRHGATRELVLPAEI